ncbi:uncharacterized protein LOC142587694 [Dermacentor variabilis]|uniref:uncharacterized protein LOC142587694 n=1 Tax=Dermacentor variabilis TaxID=34621 RepID=UPI003F5AF84D
MVLSANSPGMPLHSAADDDRAETEASSTDMGRLFKSRWIPRPCPIFRKQRMVKLFSCHLCSFSTIYAYKLKNHIGAHSGERPLCHVCLLSFSDMYGLRRHSLTHTGEKKYKCNLCSYASVTAPLLERHLRTHTGERNFPCSQCPYVCARQDTLKRHIDRVHIRGIKTESELM